MLNVLIPAILFGWIAVAIVLFATLPARRALIAGVLFATMFLPMGMVELHFIPGDKTVFTSVGLFVGALLIHPRPLFALRPKWVDLPIFIYGCVPIISAGMNGKDPYTAAADTTAEFCSWGLPYLLGRAYLTDLRALWEMACGMVIGGLIYAPFCIYEIIMSPQLHQIIYGFYQHPDWSQALRWGGYRPAVFMQHGLMLSTFMCASALVAIWLWWSGAMRTMLHIPAWILAAFLVVVGIMCKSTGAVALMMLAVAVLMGARVIRYGLLIYILAVAPFVYMAARSVGGWDGENAVDLIGRYISTDNADSLQIRLDNENLLVAQAMQKPWFGHGRGSDYLVLNNVGEMISVPDGLWVIAFGTGGAVGLVSLFMAMILPAVVLLRRFPARSWKHPTIAGAAALAVFVMTYTIDCLMNAMVNPIYIVALGGIATVAVTANPMPAKSVARRQRFRFRRAAAANQNIEISEISDLKLGS